MMRESYVRHSPGEPGKEHLYMTYFASWPEMQHFNVNICFLPRSSEAILVQKPIGLPFFFKNVILNGNSLPRPCSTTVWTCSIFLYWWLSHWHHLLAHILDLMEMCSGAVGCLLLGCQTDESVNQPGLQSCQMLQTPSDLLASWEQETVVGVLCYGSLNQESSAIAGVVESVLEIIQRQKKLWNIFLY